MARPPKPKQNPVQTAVRIWLDSLPATLLESLNEQLGPSNANKTGMDINGIKQTLLDRAPKRWVVYEPMVLLPSGSFSSAPWPSLLSSLTPSQKEPLWTAVLHHISPSPSKPPLTHLAINEGIPLHLSKPPLPPSPPPPTTTAHDNNEEEHQQATRPEENLLRAPTSLHPLYGAFGPSVSSSSSSSPPTPADFAAALWVTTKQNGLHQTWAPLHTMFSRGNVKEKARLLAFHSSSPPSPSQQHPWHPRHPRRLLPARALRGKWAVDLYAGIGYFTLSYAALGLRVLCWELNPWSVEGLRRGARMNGFEVRVVTPPPAVSPGEDGEEEEVVVDMEALFNDGAQIVVFLEDNAFAAHRVREAHARGLVKRDEVVHVNCGFLPSSEGVWRDAFGMVGGEGWLHLHENVGVGEIEGRKGAVQGLFDEWTREDGEEEGKEATVEHVELVKTYAPDVWHCVFDVFITRSSAE